MGLTSSILFTLSTFGIKFRKVELKEANTLPFCLDSSIVEIKTSLICPRLLSWCLDLMATNNSSRDIGYSSVSLWSSLIKLGKWAIISSCETTLALWSSLYKLEKWFMPTLAISWKLVIIFLCSSSISYMLLTFNLCLMNWWKTLEISFTFLQPDKLNSLV